MSEAALQHAVALLQAGRAADAEQVLRQQLAGAGDHAEVYGLLGLALAEQQRDAEAVVALRRACALAPEDAAARINLANALRRSGDASAARELLLEVERSAGRSPEIDANLGLACLALADFRAASDHLARACWTWPDDVELALCLIQAELELGEDTSPRRALERLGEAPRQHPDWSNLAGMAWSLLNETARAEALYRHALQLDPGHEQALANLIALLERVNRLDDARSAVGRAAAVADPRAPVLRIAQARLAVRDKRMDEALALYRGLHEQELPERVAMDVAYEYGKLLDRADQPAPAMAALQRGHELSLRLLARNHPDTYAHPPQDDWHETQPAALSGAAWAQQRNDDGLPEDPVFVVGFPRSGTTLLEQILGSHPGLQPMDEVLAVERALHEVAGPDFAYPHDLANLDADQIKAARAAYWAEAGRAVALDPTRRLVDKYPFNLVRLPVIARLFPRAHVVLLLRHPADCVLSCYMQKFRLNKGTHAWARLDSTAGLYDRAFTTWERHRNALSVPVHVLKYETLVQDFEASVRALLDFLGLPWDERVGQFQRTAHDRGRISTPSYAQVTEPIYDRAIGRWQRYQPWLGEALPVLAPWCQRYGYTIAAPDSNP